MVNSPKFSTLTLAGGGVKGYCYVGVVTELERIGILDNINCVAGTSAGAIGAVLIATGHNSKVLFEYLKEINNFPEMAKRESPTYAFAASLLAYISRYGRLSGKSFVEFFHKVIFERTGIENCTFAQWHDYRLQHPELKMKDIIIEAGCIDTKFNEIFSYKTTPDVIVADAARASMGVPVIFVPYRIKDKEYTDGGMQVNYPIYDHEIDKQHNYESLGIWLDTAPDIEYLLDKGPAPIRPVRSSREFAFCVGEIMLRSESQQLKKSQYLDQTIFCDTLDVATTDFNISEAKISALIYSGQYSVPCILSKRYPEFCKEWYNENIIDKIIEHNHPSSLEQFVMLATEEINLDGNNDPLWQSWVKMPDLIKRPTQPFVQDDGMVVAPTPEDYENAPEELPLPLEPQRPWLLRFGSLEERLKSIKGQLDNIRNEININKVCPISKQQIREPAQCLVDGRVYERAALHSYLKEHLFPHEETSGPVIDRLIIPLKDEAQKIKSALQSISLPGHRRSTSM